MNAITTHGGADKLIEISRVPEQKSVEFQHIVGGTPFIDARGRLFIKLLNTQFDAIDMETCALQHFVGYAPVYIKQLRITVERPVDH